MLLQESWNALENADYGVSQLKANKIGMFVGVKQGDYKLLGGSGSITANHYDGKTNGITAPSGVAQEELLTTLHSRYGVNPGEPNMAPTG